MKQLFRGIGSWLPGAVLVLFVSSLLCFSLAVQGVLAAAAGDGAALVYHGKGKLLWEGNVSVSPDGSAQIDFFTKSYLSPDGQAQTVHAQDGDHLIAPGTARSQSVSLQNRSGNPIHYQLALYRYDELCQELVEISELPLNVRASKAGEEISPDQLPQSFPADPKAAYGGVIQPGGAVDCTLEWKWDFERGDSAQSVQLNDKTDTAMGDHSAYRIPDDDHWDAALKVYAVVWEDEPASEQDGSDPLPPHRVTPQTSDTAPLVTLGVVMALAALVMLISGLARRKAHKPQEQEPDPQAHPQQEAPGPKED